MMYQNTNAIKVLGGIGSDMSVTKKGHPEPLQAAQPKEGSSMSPTLKPLKTTTTVLTAAVGGAGAVSFAEERSGFSWFLIALFLILLGMLLSLVFARNE